MMTSDQIIDDVIRRETGGVPWALAKAQLHAADKGSWTRGGITVASWGDYANLGRHATPEELNQISEPQMRAFYKARHIDVFGFAPDPLRLLLADWSATSWIDDPTEALQRALLKRGFYKKPDGRDGRIDGDPGPLTRAAMTEAAEINGGMLLPLIYRDVFIDRVLFYVDLGRGDTDTRTFLRTHPKAQLHNLKGWCVRALEFTP